MRAASLLILPALFSLSNAGDIKVLSDPVIQAYIGKSVAVKCEFTNLNSEDMILWKKGDNPIFMDRDAAFDDDRYQLNEDEEAVNGRKVSEMTVSRLTTDDDGQFLCGLADPEQWKSVRVRVNVPPTVHITPEVWPYVVLVGEPVTIKCTTNGNPKPIVHWSKEGGTFSDHVSIESHTIRIPSVQKADAGIYTCYANSTAGHARTQIDMRVNDYFEQKGELSKPWVRTPTKYVPVVVNGAVNLTCQYDGNPTPQVEWLFNGQRLTLVQDFVRQTIKQYASRHENYSESILEINSASPDYFGDYSCRASNLHGDVATAVYLSAFVGPPTITIDDNAMLTITATAPDGIKEFAIFYRNPEQTTWEQKQLVQVDKDDQVGEQSWSKTVNIKDFLQSGRYEIQVQGINGRGYGSYAREMLRVEIPEHSEAPTASSSISSLLGMILSILAVHLF